MLLVYGAFILSLLSLSSSFANEDKLEPRFRGYRIIDTDLLDSLNGGPIRVAAKINGREMNIYAPQINEETLAIKPRPEKIANAIKQPEQYFHKDVAEAMMSFDKFSKEYRDCVNSRKWPQKAECFKKLDVCFGAEYGPSICDWEQHETINDYAHQHKGRKGLIEALNNVEKVFDLISKCFDTSVKLSFMFDIYGKDAQRRNYYTVDSEFDNSDFGGMTICRFTVMNKNQYNLIWLSSGGLGRPGLSTVPLDIYVKDNYYELLQNQKEEKKRVEKATGNKNRKKK